jgi:serine/threonine protein kinase/Flp pilus assembly protein TadD
MSKTTLRPGQTLSHFRVIDRLGEGGMGAVWRATDTTLGREVALKVLSAVWTEDPERMALFEHEARTLAALNHPNIVTIYSVEEADGIRFITMELVRGRALDRLISPGGMPLKQLLDVAIPVAEAVSAAHQQGITHRDLKPANIMVGEGGRVKVLDFGLARRFMPQPGPEGESAPTLTFVGEPGFTGTVSYMSPEQAQGLDVDHRSDNFSLGIILYEMATGRKPFDGPTPAAIIASILRDTPAPPTRLNPNLPLRLGRIISSCLEKDPELRCPSVGELSRLLAELRSDLRAATRAIDRSVAVLPFADLSPERNQDYLCEGIAEEILIALGKVKGLRVVSRQSSFRFKKGEFEIGEIGELLGVSTLLGGSIRKSGDRLRISVELIDVTDGFTLWSERYDRDIRDVFAVQDEIAHRVVEALQLTLSAKERDALRRASTQDVDAFDYYLRGRKFFYKYDKQGITFALELFERAIDLDPSYARAYSGVADSCAYLYMYAGRENTYLERAEAAAKKAVSLDPDLAEAHASLGTALSLSHRHAEAEQSFRTAIRLNPGLFEAHYFFARDSFAQGKLEQAIEQYEEASRARPEDYQSPLLVAQSYDDLGRHEEAAASRRKGVAIVAEHLKLNPDDVRALYMGANGLVALGEIDKGLAWARRALDLDPRDPMLLYNVACIYSLAGKAAEALDCLERSVDAGLNQKEWLQHDSNLDLIRQDPRFAALMKRLGG